VRLGGDHDGGYVVCRRSVLESDALLSLGLSFDWTFEEAFVARNDIDVHVYDHTVSMRRIARFSAKQLLRGAIGDALLPLRYERFFRGRRRHFEERIGDAAGCIDVEGLLARLVGRERIFLKMDIEGAEHRVFPHIVRHAERFSGIAVEVHDLDLHLARVDDIVLALREHFDVVHAHVNNWGDVSPSGTPVVVELTFDRRRGESLASTHAYPVDGLDRPNDPRLPDVAISFDAVQPPRASRFAR
jgi:hypothetical protein